MLNTHCAEVVLGTIMNGQEEVTLYIVKCLKENRKLVFQIRNKVCSTTMSRTKLKQQENTCLHGSSYSYSYRSYPSQVKKYYLLISIAK